jgi:oligopeptide/dipeptide ABC transporter ATP-binding protein
MSSRNVLEVSALRVATSGAQPVELLSGVSLTVGAGQLCGLIGETGSGKSLTAWSIIRMLESPLQIVGGSVTFDGVELSSLPVPDVHRLRGSQIATIVQNPMAALHPMKTIGDQLVNMYRVHRGATKVEARERALDALTSVGLDHKIARVFPHQLSGGMAQRAVIAMALICEPRLILADEPTTGLDLTIQAEILDIVRERAREHGISVLLITHDLGIVANYCDWVAVMFAGKVVEDLVLDGRRLPDVARHPYTRALIEASQASVPKVSPLTGEVPNPADRDWDHGCEFARRCALAQPVCRTSRPPLVAHAHGQALCHRVEGR